MATGQREPLRFDLIQLRAQRTAPIINGECETIDRTRSREDPDQEVNLTRVDGMDMNQGVGGDLNHELGIPLIDLPTVHAPTTSADYTIVSDDVLMMNDPLDLTFSQPLSPAGGPRGHPLCL